MREPADSPHYAHNEGVTMSIFPMIGVVITLAWAGICAAMDLRG